MVCLCIAVMLLVYLEVGFLFADFCGLVRGVVLKLRADLSSLYCCFMLLFVWFIIVLVALRMI